MDISVSDIRNWKECGRKDSHLRRLGRHEAAGPRRVGQAAHAVCAGYVEHLWKTQQDTDLTVARNLAEKTAVHLSPTDEQDLRSFIFQAIEGIDGSMLRGAQTCKVEERLHICVQCGTQVMLDGSHDGRHDTFSFTPDLWWVDADGFLHVWDWKSGHVIQHVDHPDEMLQLDMYLGALMKIIGLPAGFVHLYHLRHGKHEMSGWAGHDQPHTPKLAQQLTLRWEMQCNEALMSMRAHDTEIFVDQHDDYGAVYGSHCADCDVRGGCATYQMRMAESRDEQDMEWLLADMVNLEDRVRLAKDRIKKALSTAPGGVIRSTSHEAYLAAIERNADWAPDMFKKMQEILPETDLLYVFQPTRTRLEKVLRKHKMADMLDALEAEYKHAAMSTDMKVKRRQAAGHQTESASPTTSESSNSGESSSG